MKKETKEIKFRNLSKTAKIKIIFSAVLFTLINTFIDTFFNFLFVSVLIISSLILLVIFYTIIDKEERRKENEK